MPPHLVDAPSSYARPLIIDLNDIKPVLSEGISPTEGAVISPESAHKGDQVVVFFRGYGSDSRESRFEASAPCFDLNHHDGSFFAPDQIRLKTFCSPVGGKYGDPVALQESLGNTLSPSTV
jgi:hypothetical protein